MGWGELVTAIVGVLVGVAATEAVHVWRARIENPAIRLTVRPGSSEGAYVLNNLGYACAYKVGVTAGWIAQSGRYRPTYPIKDWREVPAGAELKFVVPMDVARTDGIVLMVAWREAGETTPHRRMQQWPIK